KRRRIRGRNTMRSWPRSTSSIPRSTRIIARTLTTHTSIGPRIPTPTTTTAAAADT
ncbi:hypothetical protein IWW52_003890, partial [Coemansia sp. RSA 2704]